MGQETETIGIAVVVDKVCPSTALRLEALPPAGAGALSEVSVDGPLAGVTKGGIAHIVRQTGCGDDGADVGEVEGQLRFLSLNSSADGIAERATDAGDLERVGEAVVDKDLPGEGEDLRLILQPAEGGTEDQPIVVPLVVGSTGLLGRRLLLAEALTRHESRPVHLLSFLLRHGAQIFRSLRRSTKWRTPAEAPSRICSKSPGTGTGLGSMRNFGIPLGAQVESPAAG